MTKKRSAWTCLVDADGNPYKNATATKVKIAADADADDLRNAIKIKFDSPEYLRDVSAGTLKIYKNKNSFDQKESPLDEEDPIGTLGGSKREALVVVVPTEQNLAGPSITGN